MLTTILALLGVSLPVTLGAGLAGRLGSKQCAGRRSGG